jgi:hypothetical protein
VLLTGPTVQELFMTFTDMRVTSAGHADVADVAELAASYMWDSPLAAWLVAEPERRTSVLVAWYSLVVEQALAAGHTDLTADRRAAAVWLDCTRPVPALPHYARRLTAACGRYAIPLLHHASVIEQRRPRSGHFYLAALAADPQRGRSLLSRRHRQFDHDGVVSYATSVSDDQHAVLVSSGYQHGVVARLPNGPHVPLLYRAPAASATAGEGRPRRAPRFAGTCPGSARTPGQ